LSKISQELGLVKVLTHFLGSLFVKEWFVMMIFKLNRFYLRHQSYQIDCKIIIRCLVNTCPGLEFRKPLTNLLRSLFEWECFIANVVGIFKVCFWYWRHQQHQTDYDIDVRSLSNLSPDLGLVKLLTHFLGSLFVKECSVMRIFKLNLLYLRHQSHQIDHKIIIRSMANTCPGVENQNWF
jgi:hypothetical protein